MMTSSISRKNSPTALPEEHFQPNPKVLTIIGRINGRVPGFDRNLVTGVVQHGNSSVWLMQPAHTLRGRVTDEQGQPVVGAVVKAGVYPPMGDSNGINTATTDADGNYEITDLAALDAAEERRRRSRTFESQSRRC